MTSEQDLETLTFHVIQENGENKILILDSKQRVEDEFSIGALEVSLLEKKDKFVIAQCPNDIEYVWNLDDLNHPPKIHGLNPAILCASKEFLEALYPKSHKPDRKKILYAARDFMAEVTGDRLERSYASLEVQVPTAAMRIIPLGIGNANPQNSLGNSCFLLEADKKYLIDFPKGAPPENIKDIFITHVHNDHLGSLVDFLLVNGPKEDPKERVNIYTISKIREQLISILNLLGLKTRWGWEPGELWKNVDVTNFANLITLEEALSESGADKDISYTTKSGLKIETRWNMHGDTPSIGLKFNYKNRKLGISGDCNINRNYICHKYAELLYLIVGYNVAPNVKLENLIEKTREQYAKKCINWFNDCNLIFHEATSKNVAGNVHTFIGDLEKELAHQKDKLFVYHIEDSGFKSDIFPLAQRGRTYRV